MVRLANKNLILQVEIMARAGEILPVVKKSEVLHGLEVFRLQYYLLISINQIFYTLQYFTLNAICFRPYGMIIHLNRLI